MKKGLFVFVVLALVLSTVMPVLAQAGVDTVAVVDGTAPGNAPVINAAWNLCYDPGPGLNDQPAAGLQVTPKLSVSPTNTGPQSICAYAIVSDPNGIGNLTGAFIRVYHPDGSLKFEQIPMNPIKNYAGNLEVRAVVDAYINDAAATGQLGDLTPAQAKDLLSKGVAFFYWVCWPYHNHQDPGCYTVEFNAIDAQGNITETNRDLEILGLFSLQLDFSQVNYGNIIPDTYKSIPGDNVWDPSNSMYPTVWNAGNADASLRLRWKAMLGATHGKRLVKFDARLSDFTPQQYVNAVVTDSSTWWSPYQYLPGPLEPCTPTQIDFSITPKGPPDQPFVPADTYNGQIEIGFVPFQNPS